MARYLIERNIDGWTDDDVDAAGIRAKMCAPWFEGLDWVISYRDPQRAMLFCIYDAHDEDAIRAHSRFAGLPADAVHVVMELHPEDVDGEDSVAPEAGQMHEQPAG